MAALVLKPQASELQATQQEPQENGQEHVQPPPVVLRCFVPSLAPSVESHAVAHLHWQPPCYKDPPAGIELPPLNVLSYQIDWAEATFRPGGILQHIADDDWRPLPSGDVGVPEVKVGGLRPGKSYAVRVSCTLDLQHVDARAWHVEVLPSPARVFTTLPTVPSAVKPPLLVAKDRKFLKVKWNIPDEPGGENMPLTYQLFMAPPPTGWTGPPSNAQGFVEVYHGPDRSFKVVKLVPGARYSFWVLARNTVGYSEPGQVAHYTTQATVPAQPSPPRPVSCTQSSITLQWVAPAGNGAAVTNYVLERDEGLPATVLAAQQAAGLALPPPQFQLAYAGPLQTVMVGGLRSGLHYRFRLRAENDEGASFWSECCIATPAPSTPGIPGSVTITSITQQSATVSWAAPLEDGGAPVLTHEVELQAISRAAADSMGPDWLRIFEGCISACTISSLQPGCTYRVRVRCANSAGWGSWCMPVELATAPDVPGAPGAPVIQQAGTTCLTLTWQPPRHNGGQRISSFLVELLPPGPKMYAGPDLPRVSIPNAARAASPGQPPGAPHPVPPAVPGAVLVYRGEEPVAQVVGLQPGMMYQFRVQACNSLGAGPWGEWSTLGTAPDCPSAPMPPCLSAPATSSSLRVSWQAPDAQGSPVQGYVLQAAMQGALNSAGQLVSAASQQLQAQRSASVPHLLSLLQQAQQQGNSDAPACTTSSSNSNAAAAGEPPAVAAPSAAAAAGEGGQSQQAERSASLASVAKAGSSWQQVYKGPALSTEINQLQPCTRYLLKVAAYNQVGLGTWSPIAAVTTAPAAPTTPQDVSAEPLTASDVQLAWQPPSTDHGAALTGYVIDMAPVSSGGTSTSGTASRSGGSSFSGVVASVAAGPWQQAAAVPAGQHSVMVSGLHPGRAYLFRVRAANSCGSSPSSAPVHVATHAAPPSAPQRLTVVQRAATHVKVKWEEPSMWHGAPVTAYMLELVNLQDATASSSSSHASRTTSGAAQQQQQQLQLTGAVGQAAPAEASSAQAAPAAAPAGEVQEGLQQRAQEVESQAVDASAGSLTQGPAWVEVYEGPETSTRVSDLQPGCRYALRVRARNAAGWGPTCSCDTFTTALAPPSAPEGLEACLVAAFGEQGGDDGQHNVLLRWLSPAAHPAHALVASYEVHARPVGGSVGREVRKVVGKACEVVVEELQPGQRYTLRVRAAGMEGAGHGAWSEPVEMVMPGHSRGVTDSADSMSAASGNNEVVLAPLGSANHKVLAGASEKGVSRRLAAGGRSGRQQGKRSSSVNTTACSTYSETEDTMSVASGIANGHLHKSMGRNRINTTKLVGAAAVQKRPRASFLSTLLSREVLSVSGARRVYRSSCKSARRTAARYKWQLMAVMLLAFVGWMLRWVVLRIMSGPASARVRSAQYF